MGDAYAAGAIVGRYRIERLLGRGGMGEVWLASPSEGGAPVALKVMRPEAARRPNLRKRFVREARAAMAVPHPNIVRIVEAFEHQGLPVIAMEVLKGESLEERLTRSRPPLDEICRILVRVTSAVGTAHAAGIVHRDLKPDNIYLGADDVKVLDFGIAKLTATHGAAAQTAALTKTGAVMGTPFYMAPEQAFGDKRIDHRADIWSLGIILYRCLTGVLPTSAATVGEVLRKVLEARFPPVSEVAPAVPADLAAMTMKMIAKAAADRPWDLREVHEVLQRHAHTTAPAFGTATLCEEVATDAGDSGESETEAISAEPPTARAAPSPDTAAPLLLKPKGLQLARPALKAGAMTPTGTISLGDGEEEASTVALAPAAAAAQRTLASTASTAAGGTTGASASGARTTLLVVALLVLAAAGAAWVLFR